MNPHSNSGQLVHLLKQSTGNLEIKNFIFSSDHDIQMLAESVSIVFTVLELDASKNFKNDVFKI